MVLDVKGVPAVRFEAFLPFREDVLQVDDVELRLGVFTPETHVFELEHHVHLAFLLADPKVGIVR